MSDSSTKTGFTHAARFCAFLERYLLSSGVTSLSFLDCELLLLLACCCGFAFSSSIGDGEDDVDCAHVVVDDGS